MDPKKLLPQPPQKHDALIAEDKTLPQMEATVMPWRGDFAYREGYRRAGRILTKYVAEHGEASYLVYPICYSYRHSVELILKHLILLGCRVVRRRMTPAEEKLQNKTHSLWALWNAFLSIEREVVIERDHEPRPPEDMHGIEAYIRQLDEVDPGSDHFRYAVTPKGESTLKGVDQLNVGRFSLYMERLCAYLEGFDIYYVHLVETDMDSDY